MSAAARCTVCGSPAIQGGLLCEDHQSRVDADNSVGVGTKFDAAKRRWDLLPFGSVERIVDVITFGARKYAPNNWQKLADPDDRYFAALMRHLVAWRAGERVDPDSGLGHLSHAGCNLVFLMWFEEQGEVPR